MSKSPGHQKWPQHNVQESSVPGRMTVELKGQVIADSRDVVKVTEDGHPARFYFPRDDVQMRTVAPTDTTTECPFKGKASYFSVRAGHQTAKDAAWSYEEPFDEHEALKSRLAFDESKASGLTIRSLP